MVNASKVGSNRKSFQNPVVRLDKHWLRIFRFKFKGENITWV